MTTSDMFYCAAPRVVELRVILNFWAFPLLMEELDTGILEAIDCMSLSVVYMKPNVQLFWIHCMCIVHG